MVNRLICLVLILTILMPVTGCGAQHTVSSVAKATTEPALTTTKAPSANNTLQPSVKPTNIPTNSPSEDPTVKPTAEITPEPTPEPTLKSTPEPTPTPTLTPAPTSTCTPTPKPNPTPTAEPDQISSMSDVQRNSINMLNYITFLTQEINDSKDSRVFLESAYSALINNTYPNAVDARTQAQMTSLLDTLEGYRMITVKRERIEFIYEQNRAQALRQAVPNPMALLSAVQSGSLLKAAASVIYMTVDSAAKYSSATSQADMQYLKDGWELDDEEASELHNSRKTAFAYMLSMVRDNALPGDYALNEASVQSFVSWKNNTNIVRRIAWLEANEKTYKGFGPYWLELAKSYYNHEDYQKCLKAVGQYESVATRIFRKDYDYATILPMAIISAKIEFSGKDYIQIADRYAGLILSNTDDTDWMPRYFVAQTYLDLYANSKDKSYLERAYRVVFENVNVLVDVQRQLNEAYLASIQEVSAKKGATKREKNEVKQYNKLLKAQRKVELPPVSEALYLNCDMLFALAKELNISTAEQKRIEYILHENGERIFLAEALDNRFWFSGNHDIDADAITVIFEGGKISLPATCITDRSTVSVSVSGKSGKAYFNDWIVESVDRPKNADCSNYTVLLSSKNAAAYKFQVGDRIVISIIPVQESPEESLEFRFDALAVKKALVFNGIVFGRVR